MMDCKIDEAFPYGSWFCLKSHQWVAASTQKKEFSIYLHLFENASSNRVNSVNFIVFHSVTSYDATQEMSCFSDFLCQELSDNIWQEWFGSDNLQTLLYLNTCAQKVLDCVNVHENAFKKLLKSLGLGYCHLRDYTLCSKKLSATSWFTVLIPLNC